MNQMSPAGTLAVTKNLIDLERGSDELLLVNSFYMRRGAGADPGRTHVRLPPGRRPDSHVAGPSHSHRHRRG